MEAGHRVKALLADGIADDLGAERSVDIRPALFTCMLVAGNAHVAQSWAGKRFNRSEWVASLLAAIDTKAEVAAREYAPGGSPDQPEQSVARCQQKYQGVR